MIRLVGNAMLASSALAATLSVLVYLRVPWYRSPMGRHLMVYMVVIAVVMDLSCLRLLVGDSPGFQLLRLVTFAGMPAVLWWRFWLLISEQRATKESINESQR